MADRKMSVKELALRMNRSTTNISELKNTDQYPQISGITLNKLCSVLKCRPEDLIEYTPDKEES